jgi:hypothetical protein
MKKSQQQIENKKQARGNVYVMTHSFFSDVIRIGCTPEDPQEYTKSLSAKSPGDYTLVFSLQCDNPCKIKKRIQEHLNAQAYVQEFYQISAEVAERLFRRETLVIPTINTV